MAVETVHSKEAVREYKLVLVDDLIRQLAEEDNQAALIAYPRKEQNLSDYAKFTAREIDTYVSNAADRLVDGGLMWQPGVNPSPSVVALLGPSNFEHMITMFALSRLGYTVLMLSTRLPVLAYESLLDEVQCNTLVSSSNMSATVDQIKQKRKLKSIPMIPKDNFQMNRSSQSKYSEQRSGATLSETIAFIMHSSGSTGLPKCIYLSHTACLHNFSMGYPLECLLTVPLYHMHGHSSLYRAMYQRKVCFMYNASLPLTATNLIATLEAVQPELILTVPYGLKLLSDSQKGTDALRICKLVSYAGAGCPDELGHHLTACGVKLVSTFGLSEVGAVMQSDRPDDDQAWSYLRIIPSIKPYTWMKPIGGRVYELVILDGLKSKTTTNSDDPPSSYHTKDLFVAHEFIPDAWKHIGRLDDRVTLTNGEKVLPLPIEGRIRQESTVREAVVFGIGRAAPGLLVFRSDESRDSSDDEFIEKIWPAVQDANSRAESFSQIGREAIVPLPRTRVYPETDKGTIIRAQVYQVFAPEISATYERLEKSGEGTLRLGIDDLRDWLFHTFNERLSVCLMSTEENFFTAGVDSLQATRMLNIIRRELDLNGMNPSTNAVYDAQNTQQLAQYLHDLQTGTATQNREQNEISSMAETIETYSTFDKHVSKGSTPENSTVLLTGATGSLGSHILSQLLQNQSISWVYCPVRAVSPTKARDRLLSSLLNRHFHPDQHQLDKIYTLQSNSIPDLAPSLLEELHIRLTHIIHCAWPVNFNLPLSSFIPHITTLQHLLQLSLSPCTPNSAHFIFCSSISSASSCPSPVPETPLSSLTYAANTGYARSKLAAEKIIQKAVESAGANATILRIGQIAGDTAHGMWPDNEAIPLMVRSALTTHALPALNERCAWLPVDTVASSVLDMAGLGSEAHQPDTNPSLAETQIFNLVNPHSFSWTETFLPALRAAGLRFDTLPAKEWLQRLRDSEQDVENNPAVKLLEFWSKKVEALVGGEEKGRSGGQEEGVEDTRFDTAKAWRKSPALRIVPELDKGGFVSKVVQAWMEKWTGSSGG